MDSAIIIELFNTPISDLLVLYSHFQLDPLYHSVNDLALLLNRKQIGHMNADTQDLVNAIDAGDMGQIKKLLINRPEQYLNQEYDGYVNPLIYASYKSNYDIVEFLLTDETLRDKLDINSIYYYKKEEQEFAFEIEANLMGRTALMVASDLNIVKLLLLHGADPNIRDLNDGKTALMFAIEKKLDPNILGSLINVTNVNIQDKKGDTAVMYAISYLDSNEIAISILNKGYDINIQNKRKDTALIFATQRLYSNLVNYILTHFDDVNVNIQNDEGNTALIIAVDRDYATENEIRDITQIVNSLLNKGADKTIQNYRGETAYYYAMQNKFTSLLNVLK